MVSSSKKERGSTSGAGKFRRTGHRSGYTLLELIVAMTLCAFALALLFYSWNYISNHTIVSQRKTMFQADADRSAQSIAAELRQSPEVLSVTDNGVVFLAANGVDTVTYDFSAGELLKNNFAVSCIAPRARVSRFSIEKETGLTSNPDSKTAMITLTVGMEDAFGDVSLITLKVRIAFRESGAGGSSRPWNF